MGFWSSRAGALCVAALLLTVVVAGTAAPAAVTPSGFTDEVVWTGLTNPTAVRFAPDGRAFVAEKSGLIKVFDGLTDPTPTVFADLRTKVHNFWDRGLLSLALDPNFPTRPYVYVLLHLRRGDRRHRAALGHGRGDVRRLPDTTGRDG